MILQSQEALREAWINASSSFFESYSKIPAFVKGKKDQNGAVRLFEDARISLESKLKQSQSSVAEANERDSIVHALLALVYWLYPDYPGYDRESVAMMMLKHSVASIKATSNKFCPSYVVAIFVQLRVLSFLVRSKKANAEEMTNRRKDANSLLEMFSLDTRSSPYFETNVRSEIELFKGMTYDALAFSHYQLERDNQVALGLLDASVKSLSEANKLFHRKELNQRNATIAKVIRSFCDSIASVAHWDYGLCYESIAENLEGEEKLSYSRMARSKYEKSYRFARRTSWDIYKGLGAYSIAGTYARESETAGERRSVHDLLKKSVSVGEEALKSMSRWSTYESDFLGGSMIAEFYRRLAEYSSASERKKYTNRSLELSRKAIALLEKLGPKSARYSQVQIGDIFYGNARYYYQKAIEQRSFSSTSKDSKKLELNRVVDPLKKSLENCLKSKLFFIEDRYSKRAVDACLLSGEVCFELINCNIGASERTHTVNLARRECREAVGISRKMGWNEKVGESNWLDAQVADRKGSYELSAQSYLLASKAYVKAGKTSANAKRMFEDFGSYMRALSRVELAKTYHRKSNFAQSSLSYLESSNLISSTKRWRELSYLYYAESLMEKAEGESVADRTQAAIDLFDDAILELTKFVSSNKRSQSEDSTDLRFGKQLIDFCKARVSLERSKESFTIGNVEESIKKLTSAEAMFQDLSQSPTSDSIRANELESMASLCRAMKSFQRAQVDDDPKLYLEAKQIFTNAAKSSTSKALRPLLSGLSGFASFLYFSSEIEKSLDATFSAEKLAECNRALESSQAIFQRIGNKSFLNMLKASKHILNATIKMSAAEREVERAREKAKLYSDAQRSLSLASKYYNMLGSSKRVGEAIRMISAVRNHKRLIPLAHDIIAEVASNQIIYSAIANSSFVDESRLSSTRFRDAAYVALECEVDKPYVAAGENCTLGISISNLGRDPISIVKIDEALPEEFEQIVVAESIKIESQSIKLNFRLDPGATRQIAIKYRSLNPGDYVWHPSLIYLDSMKNYRLARSQSIKSVVESASNVDFKALLEEKAKLEQKLEVISSKRDSTESAVNREETDDEFYSLKEKISKIDETFLRTKNEHEALRQELTRVQEDITSIENNKTVRAEPQDKAELENEAKLLNAKIERRRLLLEQARLL